MPRKPASSTTRTRRTSTRRVQAAYTETPRIISDAEKHQLIRIHAASRAPQDPLQRTSLWAGVSLCVAVLLVGWWMTVGTGIQQTVTSGEVEELRALTEELDRFTEEVETNPLLNPPPVAPSTTSEATAAEFDTALKSTLGLEQSTTTERTQELMVPAPENVPPPTPVTPPGLTPDETP